MSGSGEKQTLQPNVPPSAPSVAPSEQPKPLEQAEDAEQESAEALVKLGKNLEERTGVVAEAEEKREKLGTEVEGEALSAPEATEVPSKTPVASMPDLPPDAAENLQKVAESGSLPDGQQQGGKIETGFPWLDNLLASFDGIVGKVMAVMAPLMVKFESMKQQFEGVTKGKPPEAPPAGQATAVETPVQATPVPPEPQQPQAQTVQPPAQPQEASAIPASVVAAAPVAAVAVETAVASPTAAPATPAALGGARESQPAITSQKLPTAPTVEQQPTQQERLNALVETARGITLSPGNQEDWVSKPEQHGFDSATASGMIGAQVKIHSNQYFGQFKEYGIKGDNIHTLEKAAHGLLFQYYLKEGGSGWDIMSKVSNTSRYAADGLAPKLGGVLKSLEDVMKSAPGMFQNNVELLEKFSEFTGIGFMKEGQFQLGPLQMFLTLKPESMNRVGIAFREWVALQTEGGVEATPVAVA